MDCNYNIPDAGVLTQNDNREPVKMFPDAAAVTDSWEMYDKHEC